MKRPFYTSFAWAYDLLIQEPVSERLEFVVDQFEQRDIGSGAHVLDAGCGTGRYSVALAERGFRVSGIDASADLIAEARAKQGKVKTQVDFIVADICKPHRNVTVDAILCRGVLNDLTDDASRRAVFSSFADMMRRDGVLVLDVREWEATVARKMTHPVFEREVETARGRLRFRSVTKLQPETRTLVVSETHELASSSGPVAGSCTFVMRCWTQEELDARLTDAGFHTMQYFGDYDSSKALGSGDRIVAVASVG